MGVMPTQMLGNRPSAHQWGSLQYLVVPEPQHAVALGFKEAGSARFLFPRWFVLDAIDFDDQSRFVADEVGNEAPERHLTAKSVPFGLAPAQPMPDPLLGFGHLAPQCLGSYAGAVAWLFLHLTPIVTRHHPHPALPHRGGGIGRLGGKGPQQLLALRFHEFAAAPFRRRARASASGARYRGRPGSGRQDRARRRRLPRGSA